MKQITIIGYLGDKPKIEKKEDKTQIIFNVAVTTKRKDKDGNEIEKTDWFSCFKTYNKKPVELLKYLLKGTRVCIVGDISFSQTMAENGGVYFNKNIYASVLNLLLDKKKLND